MSYGNRGILAAAIAGLITVSSGLSYWLALPPQSQNRAERNEASAQIEAARRDAASALKESGDASKYNPPCHKGQEDRQSDLCAQWRAADAGQSSAGWARLSFIAGVILGFLTLLAAAAAAFYARRAAHHTESGAIAAREQADLASAVNAAELRPYLFVERIEHLDSIEFSTFELKAEDPRHLQVRSEVFIQNFGKIPARNIRVQRRVYIASFGTGRFWRHSIASLPLSACASGQSRRIYPQFVIKSKEREAYEVGETVAVIRLFISFEDDEGNVYKERASYFFSGEKHGGFFLYDLDDVRLMRKNRRQYAMLFRKKE